MCKRPLSQQSTSAGGTLFLQQQPPVVAQQGLAIGGAAAATAAAGGAQPQVKIITPSGPHTIQQVQTPSGPKLIAVPVGQAAAVTATATPQVWSMMQSCQFTNFTQAVHTDFNDF